MLARPGASAKDIAEETVHLEQLFSASKGELVWKLYDAVPDKAAWRAMGEAGHQAQQLELYKTKPWLEIDAHMELRARFAASGDVEGVIEAEETLAELQALRRRAASVTEEELAAGPVELLKEEPPWLFAKTGEVVEKRGAVRQGGEVLGPQGGTTPRADRRQAMRETGIPTS